MHKLMAQTAYARIKIDANVVAALSITLMSVGLQAWSVGFSREVLGSSDSPPGGPNCPALGPLNPLTERFCDEGAKIGFGFLL